MPSLLVHQRHPLVRWLYFVGQWQPGVLIAYLARVQTQSMHNSNSTMASTWKPTAETACMRPPMALLYSHIGSAVMDFMSSYNTPMAGVRVTRISLSCA